MRSTDKFLTTHTGSLPRPLGRGRRIAVQQRLGSGKRCG